MRTTASGFTGATLPRDTIALQMAELSTRKRDILRRVVEEYIATGEPVGSKTVVDSSGLGVSASTVRGELAELESLGLLTHPHTSAGRIPTDSGYRFYATRCSSARCCDPSGSRST